MLMRFSSRLHCRAFLLKPSSKGFFKTNILSKKDFYKILGVSQKASTDEIKKQYFKLAKEWHPDVNKSPNAKEKFASISEAYDTLGDAEKKKAYDNYGITGDEQEQYNDFMKNMGGGKNPNGGFDGFGGGEKGFQNFWEDIQDFFTEGQGNRSQEKKVKKGKDITVNLEISFMEAINGVQKVVSFDRVNLCSTCNGSKCKPGSSPTSCGNCGGSGKMNFKQGFMTIQMECSACDGEGSTIRNPCMNCYGKGSVNSSVKETINIPKGVDDNVNLRVAKKGNYSVYAPGDLYIKVKVKPHSYFKRDNYDIHTNNYINVSTAVIGGNVKVKTLYGDVTVHVEPGTNEGDTKKIMNYGISKLPPNQHQKGNHYVKFKIKIPSKVNDKMKKLYEELSKVEEPIDDTFNNL